MDMEWLLALFIPSAPLRTGLRQAQDERKALARLTGVRP